MTSKKRNAVIYTLIWTLGLAGQICWNIENQWFNTFVYAKIGNDPAIIARMLSARAAATTFSTFFFGTWSDRIGKRRYFVSAGYILWGIFTIVFGLTEFIPRDKFLLAAVLVVLSDTVMSFFGSMGNDAAFNAWTNDIMTEKNRGQIGAALATQPVIGTILGTVVGGFLVGSDDQYMRLFLVMGVLVIAFGVYAFFRMGAAETAEPSVRGTFWEQFFSVFRFRRLFAMRELLFVNLTVCVFFIGFNGYFAYIGNYIIYYLGFSADQMGLVEAIPLILAMAGAVPAAVLINKNKHVPTAAASILLNIAGLLILLPVRPEMIDTSSIFHVRLFLGIFLVGLGYIAFMQVTKVWVKRLYPADSRGQFEGVWIVFFVLLPMIGGSILGEQAVKISGETFVDAASGQMQYIPNGSIFLYGAVFIFLSLIPLFFAARDSSKQSRNSSEA